MNSLGKIIDEMKFQHILLPFLEFLVKFWCPAEMGVVDKSNSAFQRGNSFYLDSNLTYFKLCPFLFLKIKKYDFLLFLKINFGREFRLKNADWAEKFVVERSRPGKMDVPGHVKSRCQNTKTLHHINYW